MGLGYCREAKYQVSTERLGVTQISAEFLTNRFCLQIEESKFRN